MSRIILLFVAVCALFNAAKAQEFNARVTVSAPKLQTADPKIFKTLETQLQQFMNERKWSDKIYAPDERIEMSITITIKQEVSQTRFTAQCGVQAVRPVYNSTYNSAILELIDQDFTFDYQEFDNLDFSENQYFSNLTAMLGFYAYMVLGLDGDTFQEFGGEEYFQKANAIVNYIPQNSAAEFPGWRPGGSQRNRYWLIENILSVRMKSFRSALYMYHLAGLDQLYESPSMGLASMKAALDEIRTANQNYPATYLIQMFCQAKRDELVNTFTVADAKTKREVFDIMVKLDPTQANEYRKLLAN